MPTDQPTQESPGGRARGSSSGPGRPGGTNNPPVEARLRQALDQHAKQVKPSPEAFFAINQRISKREAAPAWHPRVLLEKGASIRLQPSMAASLVLLVALTIVTTLLLTRDNDGGQLVTTSPVTTIQPDPGVIGGTDLTDGAAGTVQPDNFGITGDSQLPDDLPGSDGAAGTDGGVPVQTVTSITPQPSTTQPSSTDHTTDGTTQPSSTDHTTDGTTQPSSTDHSTDGTTQPSSTDHTTDGTTDSAGGDSNDQPLFTPPDNSDAPNILTTLPDLSASEFVVHPLQVASRGFPVVYAEHRVDSEQLTTIPVATADQPAQFATSTNTALTSDGSIWLEVITPQGEVGWVQSSLVSVQPRAVTPILTSRISLIAQSLVALANYDDFAGDITGDQLELLLHNVGLSSRGTYLTQVLDRDGALVLSYVFYSRDIIENYLIGAAAGNVSSDTSVGTTNGISSDDFLLGALQGALTCDGLRINLAPNLQPPVALQNLTVLEISNGADCNVLVYFDFLQEAPAIVALTVHTPS